MTNGSAASLLEVNNLKTHFFVDEGVLHAVDGVSFSINPEETLGLIGESGCGKSVTAASILRLVSSPGRLVDGEILLHRDADVVDLASLKPSGSEIRAIRGGDISMIFQEPMTSLSPVHTIGNQIREAITLHRNVEKKEAHEIALDMLERVGISNPSQRIAEYPHHLSGGMRQRAMIAMALATHPQLLIADEPTTALDVTVQAQILDLIKELQSEFGMAVLFITHDLGVIAETCDRVAVMYLGKIVEYGTVSDIFYRPQHPYTIRLLKSRPRLTTGSIQRLESIEGNVPVPLDPPPQCGFVSRCSDAIAGRCDGQVPELLEQAKSHWVRCFLYE
ncbi:ABC transporter ATP-binding protein [Chloroflexi bacterium TSY]|nr:ABC transporter ATP-binding protein [Chloroflexi bacterium TSY]